MIAGSVIGRDAGLRMSRPFSMRSALGQRGSCIDVANAGVPVVQVER